MSYSYLYILAPSYNENISVLCEQMLEDVDKIFLFITALLQEMRHWDYSYCAWVCVGMSKQLFI